MPYSLSRITYSYENGSSSGMSIPENIGPDFAWPKDLLDFAGTLELSDTSYLEVNKFADDGTFLGIYDFEAFQASHEISLNYLSLISTWYTQEIASKPDGRCHYHICPVCHNAWNEGDEKPRHYAICWIPKILGEDV